MNGETNRAMAEPMDVDVPNEGKKTPEPKIVIPEKIANGTSEIGNNTSNENVNGNDTSEDNLKDCESKDITEDKGDKLVEDHQGSKGCSDDDLLRTSQNKNNDDDNIENLQEEKLNDVDDPVINSHENSNDRSIELKTCDEFVISADDLPSEKPVTNEDSGEFHLKNHEEKSVDSHQSDNNDDTHQSDHENSKNGLESNPDSNDSLECKEDIIHDSLSCIESEGKQENCSDQSDDGQPKMETFKIITIQKDESDEEVESIHSSDYSGSDLETKIEDAVSIHSDSDDIVPADESFADKSNEIIILENDTPNGTSKTPEVHEIVSDNDNDDCIVTAEETGTKNNKKSKKKSPTKAVDSRVELRRSSRTIKRKKYDDDIQPLDAESDIEEVVLEDPLQPKPIKSSTKAIIDLSAKKFKPNNQKKDSDVVIIDSLSANKTRATVNKTINSNLNQNLYQRIMSRGTSVTPISSKNTSTITQTLQVTTLPPPPILPTLTDDMFVVEAPSFIVPYVYEKPAEVPFKEFVDKWGKEIEEERVKEEQALLEKKKEEKARRERERQEKKERGELVEESEEEGLSEEAKKKKAEKAEKKERRRRRKEDDDVSWDGASSEESEDESSEEEGEITLFKNKVDGIEEIKTTAPATETIVKTDSYFDLFLGKFFKDVGASLVQEYVQTDLLKQQNRKLQREKKGGHDTKARVLSIALLQKNLEMSKKTNAPFTFEQKKCELCTFKTESELVMAHHMETPHMKNNLYRCNFCTYEIKSPHDILLHMETKHNVKGKLERAPSLHQCANCPFEDHGKGKLGRHLVACAKKFKPSTNLAPPIEWEHPAKIAKVSQGRKNTAPFQVSQFGKHHVDTIRGSGGIGQHGKVQIPILPSMPPNFRSRAPIAPQIRRPNIPNIISGTGRRNYSPPLNNLPGAKKTHPSLSITPVRQPSPASVQPLHTANAKGFVICEICDGYIKDLEQLRNHMQWIHKVKIHPKMIYNRPPLNCQKCQFRFFTDQGLERHLLGTHGLVTSSMQEAANKGKDAGRCPVCGRVYQWKLLSHVSRDHSLVLKPAHLSYKCTVCTATFGMYRQFENHVYSAHSVVAKKVIDKKTVAAKATANDNAAKQLKINDEITITPQPGKTPAADKGK